ncbi:MAG: heparan-alpha-glucosaminide N-acetyltransferase domain-containing protein [Bacteroidetes bacterium]|nr:heparan-alpha-glucosaminide N-acetyltransferase domain-containing protein [Bacteroidota bacterium]
MELKERSTSLDAFRGFTIAGMIIVNNPGSWSNIYPQLQHAEWSGWTFTDMIFPFFLFIVGVSIVFSLSKPENRNLKKILIRSLLIYAFGFFLSGFPYFNLSKIRLVGVLQRISFCYLAVTLIYLNVKSRNVKTIILLFCLIFYWLMMEFYPVPEVGAGFYDKGKNFSNWLDLQILEGHMWSQTKTWDPEGIFSTLPAIATTLFGAFTGEFLQSKLSKEEKTIWIFIAGQLLLFIGLVLDNFIPINKNIWTTSYSIFMTGWALTIFSIFYFINDVKYYKWWAKPFVIFGLNSILVFVLSGVIARLFSLIKITELESPISLHTFLYQKYFEPLASPINASLLWAISFLSTMYLVCWILWKKKIFLKI